MTVKPWTFEDFEIDHDHTWTVYDPNMARIVAVFYDGDEARKYLARRNRKQAKKRAAKEAASKLAALGGWEDFDDDGRC